MYREFGALCAIVEPKERLKNARRSVFFVGYKYGRGGYRLWDPNRLVVDKSGDVVLFEDSSGSPTLRDLAPTTMNEGEPLN